MTKREGLQCPGCGGRLADVIWTRPHERSWGGVKYKSIRRRRRCVHCGLAYTTTEHVETDGEPGVPNVPLKDEDDVKNPYLPPEDQATCKDCGSPRGPGTCSCDQPY